MIHIIKMITDEWKPFRLEYTTATARAEIINAAGSKLFVCSHLLYPVEASAVSEQCKQGFLKEWAVYINGPWQNDAHLKALDILINAGINFFSCNNWWSIGIVLTDKEGVIYTPEENGKFNTLRLDCAEAQSLMQCLFESRSEAEKKPPKGVPDEQPQKIGIHNKEAIMEQLDKCKTALSKANAFRYLDENFIFVEVERHGMNLTQKRISLKSNVFRFRNKEAERRFAGTFKMFDKDDQKSAYNKEFKSLEKFKIEINAIKGKYTHSLGQYGACIASKNVNAFHDAINELRDKKLKEAKVKIRDHLKARLERSEKALREMIKNFHSTGLIVPSKKLMRDYQKSLSGDTLDREDRFIQEVMSSLNIPSVDQIVDRMSIDVTYKRVSEQLCADQKFLDELQRKFRFKLEGPVL